MDKLGIYIGGEKVAEVGESVTLPYSNEPLTGGQWEMSADSVKHSLYLEYYHRKGNKFYLRWRHHKMVVEFTNDKDLQTALSKMKRGKYYRINYTIKK